LARNGGETLRAIRISNQREQFQRFPAKLAGDALMPIRAA
jgi:hypothetical protein